MDPVHPAVPYEDPRYPHPPAEIDLPEFDPGSVVARVQQQQQRT